MPSMLMGVYVKDDKGHGIILHPSALIASTDFRFGDFSGLMEISSQSEALTAFNGATESAKITGNGVVTWAYNKQFLDGSRGHVWSLGELKLIMDNLSTIKAVQDSIGVPQIPLTTTMNIQTVTLYSSSNNRMWGYSYNRITSVARGYGSFHVICNLY